jgi:hypothetical protein
VRHPSVFRSRLPQKHIDEHTAIEALIVSKISLPSNSPTKRPIHAIIKNIPEHNPTLLVFHPKKQIDVPNTQNNGMKSQHPITPSSSGRSRPITFDAKNPENIAPIHLK